jgi:hypothetical protein
MLLGLLFHYANLTLPRVVASMTLNPYGRHMHPDDSLTLDPIQLQLYDYFREMALKK